MDRGGNKTMELLFESRLEILRAEGKIYFIQVAPETHPEPVLEPDPDSFADGGGASIYGTVLDDGGRLRMWYQAWPQDWAGGNVNLVGYAESDDGIVWHKPQLNLVEYGNRPNNLCEVGNAIARLFYGHDVLLPAQELYRQDKQAFLRQGTEVTRLTRGHNVEIPNREMCVVDPARIYPSRRGDSMAGAT